MTSLLLKSLIAVSIPILVLFAGGTIMSHMSGRGPLINQLKQSGHMVPKPLNQRWLGYEAVEAHMYWRSLQATGRIAERTFLELDLMFPFFYLAALAASLLWAWIVGGRWFQPMWIAVPLAIVFVADWTENLIQLAHLSYWDNISDEFEPGGGVWIRVASSATIVKLWLIVGALLGLIGLVITPIVGIHRSKKA